MVDPTLADFRAAVNLPGNLRLSDNSGQAPIVRAGRFAWIRSALGIDGMRQANAQTLNALKSALVHDPRYSGASAQIEALIGRARADRPLSGRKVRVLLEKADAIVRQNAENAAQQRIDRVLTDKSDCAQRLLANLQARARQNPALLPLLNHPETSRLNEADFQKLTNFVRTRMASQEVGGMEPAERAAYHESTLDAAIAELVERRIGALSVDGLTKYQQTQLLSSLMDEEGRFANLAQQLDRARQSSAENAQRREANRALAQSLSTPEEIRKTFAAGEPDVTGELDRLTGEEMAMLQETFQATILRNADELRDVHALTPREAGVSQREQAGKLRKILAGAAWANANALQESYPREAAYLRERLLQKAEKAYLTAALVDALPRLADNIAPELLAEIGARGKTSPGALYPALLNFNSALSAQFFRLPEAVQNRLTVEEQQSFIECMVHILALRQEAQHPGSSREYARSLMTGGAARALLAFVGYWSSQGENQHAMMNLSLAYECAAQAMARQAGIPRAEFIRQWETPVVDSRMELPADTHALPILDAHGAPVAPAPIAGNVTSFPVDIGTQRAALKGCINDGGRHSFHEDMVQAAARGYRNPNENSPFVHDVARNMRVRLDGVDMPIGKDLPASGEAARASVFYAHLLRFINPDATLATASDAELAQMHILASLINQRGPLALNVSTSADGTVQLLAAHGDQPQLQAFTLDHAGEDIVLRVDYSHTVGSLYNLGDGSILALDPDTSRQTSCAIITFPRAELERMASLDWAAHGNADWAIQRPGTATPPLEFRFPLGDEQIQIHSSLTLNTLPEAEGG